MTLTLIEFFFSIDRIPDELADAEKQKEKPVFVLKPENAQVMEGEWARFCCRVTGYPRPRVMWLLNGHTVINVISKSIKLFTYRFHFDWIDLKKQKIGHSLQVDLRRHVASGHPQDAPIRRW